MFENIEIYVPQAIKKNQEEGRLPSSLYKANIILIPKADNDTTEKKV